MPRLLSERGLAVESYFDHFERSNVADNQWLAFVARRGWVALSHDKNILYDKEAVRELMENHGRLFILRGKGGHLSLAEMFGAARESIEQLLQREQSFIAKVRRVSAKEGVVRASVDLRITFAQWFRGSVPGPDVEDEEAAK